MVPHNKPPEKKEYLKLVISKDGEVIPDIYDKIPGQCYWVKFNKEEIKNFVYEESQFRSKQSKANICQKLYSKIEKQLKKSIYLKLSLARKAGNAVSGFDNVKLAINTGTAEILFHAYDGSARELLRIKDPNLKLNLVTLFNLKELGKVFNKDRIAHSCVLRCGLAKSLILDVKKLEGIQN